MADKDKNQISLLRGPSTTLCYTSVQLLVETFVPNLIIIR
jgi:hypothetical protein